MHLSMLSPRVRVFDRMTYPQGGEFDMATIFDNEEGLEINLVPRASPSPSNEGKALGTRFLGNNSAVLDNTKKGFE